MANIRCAIYTRKSTEEGLEQNFNSLDAQREACAAYITSQKHEGWQALPESYDDGGFSGGNINRPALKRLMVDIKAGKVNTIVVYKIDRLTRSLADFAKMVDVFDQYKVSFVSVTQQFNTTTSMGRLTLNVLLSFAQFEREVTGERIRDKIAASKAKGMWMGGTVALGYSVVERELVVNKPEAQLVRHIFQRYTELRSVQQLRDDLTAAGYCTRICQTKNGPRGGGVFAIGPLHHLLTNRLYLGDITHKGSVHKGNHPAIIEQPLWDKVQEIRNANRLGHEHRVHSKEKSLLAGLLVDAENRPMSSCHSNKPGKRYRYYISQGEVQGKVSKADTLTKIPAGELENVVAMAIAKFLGNDNQLVKALPDATMAQRELARQWSKDWPKQDALWRHVLIRDVVRKVRLQSDAVACELSPAALGLRLNQQPVAKPVEEEAHVVTVPVRLKRINGGPVLILTNTHTAPTNKRLATSVAKAYVWNQLLVTGKVANLHTLSKIVNCDDSYIRRTLPLSWLVPTIVEALLEGDEPESLHLADLLAMTKLDWPQQIKAFERLR
jgi:site-specific DNA recombinase